MVNGLFFYSKILAKLHILFKTCKFFDKKLESYMSMQYFSHRYLTTFGGKSLVVGLIPLASRKARSLRSQRRKVSGLTPAARESSDLV